MAKALGRRLEHERRNGNIPRVKITLGVKRVNHSQFDDDILLLGGGFFHHGKKVQNHFGLISSCFMRGSKK
jgi:hypothetical protein